MTRFSPHYPRRTELAASLIQPRPSGPPPAPGRHRSGLVGASPAVLGEGSVTILDPPAKAAARTRGFGANGRLGIVTLDQAVSGGSNLLASLVAAHTLSVRSFGVFGLLLIVYGLIQGVSRSAISMPLLVNPVSSGPRLASVVRSTWLFGFCCAALLCAVALLAAPFDSVTAQGLLTLGLCIPLLGLQDLARFIAIGALKPLYALVLDLVWLVLFVAVAVPYVLRGRGSLVEVLVLWAGSGAVTGLIAVIAWHPLRSLRPSMRWLSDNWQLSWRLTASFGSAQASTLVLAVIVREMLGSATLGAFVGAQLLTRPYTTVETAIVGAGVAEISNSGGSRLGHDLRRVTVAATGVAAVNAAFMLLLPDSLGTRILGGTWVHAQPYILPFAIQLLALGLSIGPRVGLIGINRIALSMRISIGFAGAFLVAAIVGSLTEGGLGCAWAIVGSWYAVGVIWWISMWRAKAALRPSTAQSGPLLA